MDDSVLILLLGACGMVWFLLPVVLIAVLWVRVNRLQKEVQYLRQPVRAAVCKRASDV